MVNFEDLDKEKIAEAERLLRNKVNTLGKDRPVSNESFARTHSYVPLEAIMTRTPTTIGGLIPPDYDDIPVVAALGTRHIEVRLHSYLPSGLTGPDSVQSFIAISSNPDSHNFSDIEAVRIKHLISPKYSQGNANAAHTEPYVRGFELALYPAKSNGGVGIALVADTDKPISPVADPSAGPPDQVAPGAGTTGFWSVDYENGVVRFSHPPLNGPNGVMNPNNVYGDIEGLETSDAYGAITMFATFYQYTGEYGTTENLQFITVGDGYVSDGVFTGQSHDTVQAAINSLPENGGTVFIKEGTYDFTKKVTIPQNVNIFGLGGAVIIRPPAEPAFFIADGYVTIEGLEIQPRRETVVTEGASIELGSSQAGEEIKNVVIRNNILYGQDDAPAIGFASEFDCTYKFLKITNNLFEQGTEPGIGGNIYIGGRALGGFITLNDCEISHNTFSTLNGIGQIDYATRLTSAFISTSAGIDGLNIVNNMMRLLIISVGDISLPDIYNVNISNNTCRSIEIRTDYAEHLIIQSNTVAEHFSQSWIQINCDDFYELRIDNNYVEESILIDPNNTSAVFIYFGTITNNDVENAIEISDTSASSEIDDMSISGNTTFFINLPRLWATSVASNRAGDINVCTSVITSDVMRYSSIVDNQLYTGDLVINNVGATGSTSSITFSSIISGNTGISLQIYGRVSEQVAISSNSFFGSAEFVQIGQSFSDPVAIGSNQFGSFEVSGNIDNADISGNAVRFVTITGTITNTNFSNNQFDGSATFTGALSDTAFNSNVNISSFGTLTMPGGLTRCKLTDNVYRGTINISINPGDGDISGTIFSGNTFSTVTIGNTTSGNFLESKFLDGYILTSLAINGIVTNSDVGNNLIAGSLSIASSSTITKTSIYNNKSTSFTIGNVYDSKIESNTATSTTTIAPTGLVQGSLFGNNTFGSTTITGDFNDSKFLDGYIVGSLTLNGLITNGDINNNRITTSASLGSVITNSHVSNNIVGTTFDLGGLYKSKIRSNITGSTVTIASAGPVQSTSIANNTFGGDTTISGACEEVQILDGYITGSLTISNKFLNGKIDGNRITGFFDVASSNTIGNSTINNNIIGNSSLSGGDYNLAENGVFIKSEFNSNILLADENSQETIIFGEIIQSLIIGNNMISTAFNINGVKESIINENVCTSLFGSGTISDSIVSNNRMELDFSLSPSADDNAALKNTIFASNKISTFFAVYGIEASHILDSYVAQGFTIGGAANNAATVFDSVISGNTIIGPVSFEAPTAPLGSGIIFLNSKFTNNNCNNSFIAGANTGTSLIGRNFELSNNIFGYYNEGVGMTGSILLGNDVDFPTSTMSLQNIWIENNRILTVSPDVSLTIFGKISSSKIINNIFDSSVIFDDMEETEFSSNRVGDAFAHSFNTGYFQYCNFSNNIFGGQTTFGDVALSTTADQSTINNNIFHEIVTFAETSSGCYAIILSDNFFEDDLAMCSDWFRSVISDNIHEGTNWEIGTTSTNGAIGESVISGNQSEFGILSHSTFDEVTFTNNRMTSFEIDINSTSTLSRCADQTSFTGNFIEGTMTFDFNRAGGSAILNSCVISGNSVGNIVIDSVHTAGVLNVCSIVGNTLPNSGITISGTGGDIVNRSQISSNQMFGALSINNTGTGSTVLNDSVVANNSIASGSITLGASVTGTDAITVLNNTHLTGNRVAGGGIAVSVSGRDVELLTTNNSIISDNFVSSDITIYGITFESVINSNIFTSLRFHTFSETIFSNNSLDGGVFSIVDDGYGIIADSNFSDNIIAGSINLIQNNLSGAPDAHVTVLVRSKFTGNDVGGSAYFIQQTANFYQSALDQVRFSGNKFGGNVQMQIRGSGTVLAPLEDITVINSSIDDNLILGELRILVLKDDGFGLDTFHTAIMVNSAIRNNIIMSNVFITNMGGSVSSVALDNCIISGNIIGNEITGSPGGGASLYINNNLNLATPGQVVRDTIFSDNRIFGDITIGNTTGFTFTNGDVVDSVFANNDLRHSDSNYGFINCGDLSIVTISGNVMNGLRFDTFAQTLISGNDINTGITATGSAGVQLNSITGNYIFDVTFTGTPTGTWFNGNRMSSFVAASLSSNIMIGNRLDTGIDAASISTCTIIGNIMGAFISLGSISTATIIGNTATNLAISNGTGSAILMNDVAVIGNRFSSAFTVAHTATGTGATMSESLFALNIFNGTLTLGSTGASFDHAFTKSGFIGNFGAGGLTLRTNVDTNLTGLIILGNAMGAFTYSNTALANLTNPSVTASVDFYMAFNYFASFTRVTHTATIAWITSNVKVPAAVPTGSSGSNVSV